MKFVHYYQLDKMDCGPACLRMIAKHFGKHYSAQTLRQKTQVDKTGVSMLSLAEAAESLGLRSVGVKLTIDKLIEENPFPCILHWGQSHFVVLYGIKRYRSLGRAILSEVRGGRRPSNMNESEYHKISDDIQNLSGDIHFEKEKKSAYRYSFQIADPGIGLKTYSKEEFLQNWVGSNDNQHREGVALLLEPTQQFYNTEDENLNRVDFRHLMGFLWQYKRLMIQIVLAMLVGSIFSIILPILTQSIVDIGIGTQDIPFIYLVLTAQMILLVSASLVEALRSWILLHISVRLNLTILSEFLSKLLRLPMSFFDSKRFGDIMQRIGDHQRIESFLTGQAISTIFSFFNIIIFGFMLAFYSINIFIIATVASIIYTGWVALFLKQRRSLDLKRFRIASQNQSQIVQLIQGMQDIRLLGAELVKRWEWERTQARLFKWNVKSLTLTQIQQIVAVLINNGKNIFITFLAARAVVDGSMTIGGMMSIQYILAQFNSPVDHLVNFLQSWQDAKISMERLNEVHDLKDEECKDSYIQRWDSSMDICIENVTYSYSGVGGDPALKGISLIIPSGKTTAIVGDSGSGKTSLLKLLLRFYQPQEGKIYLRYGERSSFHTSDDRINLEDISYRSWRTKCGVVMQDGFIFSDTIARNIAVSDEVIDSERLFLAARTANIHGFISGLTQGYNTLIGAEGSGLSQGQKQRILIARSVYSNPQLILFDEATNSLDANNEAQIVRNLDLFFKGRTVVIVAHRLSTVRNADNIIVMQQGKVVESGDHHNLLAKRGKYYDLVASQLEIGNN